MNNYQSLLSEIDSHRGHEFVVKNAVCVAIKQTRFADAGIAEGQELQQVIVIHVSRPRGARDKK